MTRKTRNNILIALYLVVLVFTNLFVVGIGFVSGNSMEPSFSSWDVFLLKKIGVFPDIGDVVVTNSHNPFKAPLLKRVVATQGQVLSIEGGVLSVDGTPMEQYNGIYWEKWIKLEIPENTVFLIGDNHHFSKDSRDIGVIPLDQLKGIVLFSEYYTKEESILSIIIETLGQLMNLCYQWTEEYLLSILLFTICTKIILFPVSVWVHKNAIKMIKIQPEINRIKTKHFGNPEKIAEEQSALFKQAKYNPLASLIPLFIQIGLLISVIEVIYQPLTYLLDVDDSVVQDLTTQTAALTGVDPSIPSIQISILNAVQSAEYQSVFGSLPSPDISGVIQQIQQVNTHFICFNLADTPIVSMGISLLVPLLAGLSSLLLCVVQNKSNVLQAEQSKTSQNSTLALSVGLSLYLGLFVPSGVAFYWIFGNAFAIFQLYTLNFFISPKKFVDYQALEDSRTELQALQNIGGEKKKWYEKDEHAKREKEDYKRFFSIANKKLVFYSESSGFYKYFKGIIEEIMNRSNLTIHYITSDPNDAIFELAKTKTQIKPYLIREKKLIVLMMKMDADMVVMTMPDLDNFHIKRSIVRDDVEYVYVFHAPLSYIMTLNHRAIDHYDTILATGPAQVKEVRASEMIYNLTKKTIVECGYSLIDDMALDFEKVQKKTNGKKIILLAPSWYYDNILDSCVDEFLADSINDRWKIIIRPHPEYVKRYPEKMKALQEKYQHLSEEQLIFQLDFSTNSSIFEADLLITDWSLIAYEYALATNKPVMFINTTMKVANPHWKELNLEAANLYLRDKIGISIEPKELNQSKITIEKLLHQQEIFYEDISKIRDEYLFHFQSGGVEGARYILNTLANKGKKIKSNITEEL